MKYFFILILFLLSCSSPGTEEFKPLRYQRFNLVLIHGVKTLTPLEALDVWTQFQAHAAQYGIGVRLGTFTEWPSDPCAELNQLETGKRLQYRTCIGKALRAAGIRSARAVTLVISPPVYSDNAWWTMGVASGICDVGREQGFAVAQVWSGAAAYMVAFHEAYHLIGAVHDDCSIMSSEWCNSSELLNPNVKRVKRCIRNG